MTGTLVRLFKGIPAQTPLPSRQTSVWLAMAADRDALPQHLIQRNLEMDLLVGSGFANAVGPGLSLATASATPNRGLEFLLRVAFKRSFWRPPQITPFLISTQPATDDPTICALSVQSVTADAFTLMLRPKPGSPRLTLEFGWVAAGEILPPRPNASETGAPDKRIPE